MKQYTLLAPGFELTIFSLTSSCWDITFLKGIFIYQIDNFSGLGSQYLLREQSLKPPSTLLRVIISNIMGVQ